MFIGQNPQSDDINSFDFESKPAKKITVSPQLDSMDTVIAFFDECLAEQNVPAKVAAQINIAVDEIFSNIARYSGASSVSIDCEAGEDHVVLRFADDGRPYDPTEEADPDVTLSAEERDIGGLGIFMVKKTMDDVAYEYRGGFNILTIQKRW